MNIICRQIENEREYRELRESVRERMSGHLPRPARIIGLCEGARNAMISALASDTADSGCPMLLIVPDEKEAMRCFTSLSEMGHTPAVFSFRDYIFYNITASHEYEHERLGVLTAILDGTCDIVIATPDAALQYTIPKERLAASVMTVNESDSIDMDSLKAFLVGSGYSAVETVDAAGQYSVRGGIIDIYPPGYEYPVRLELFGDDIDSMSYFDIISQRRTEPAQSLRITPAREILTDSETASKLRKIITAQLKRTANDHTIDQLSAELEAIDGGTELRFIDKYISTVYPEKECLLDYFPKKAVVVCEEFAALSERIKSYEWHQKQAVTSLLEEGAIAASGAEYGKWRDDFLYFVGGHAGVITDSFMSSVPEIKITSEYSLVTKQTVSYSENLELLSDDLASYRKSGFRVVILCENEIMAKNLRGILEEKSGAFPVIKPGEDIPDGTDTVITYGINIAGFELTASRFAVMSTYPAGSSYSRTQVALRKRRTKKKSAQEKIMSYADLSAGDYVVHVNHGIGMFLGIESVTVEGVTRDYIKIKYAGTDMLFLPCDQLENISKYIGAKGEDGTLKLSRLGGAEWGKAKSQVKAAAKEMAKELIKLYAERQRRPGFAFAPDDDMQRDFEESFQYVETDGQLQAIKEVKQDMEQPRPMDRLLCGDVGFGKTEVAMRAAFKAVESGKQAAILVPTTILALQHYQTLLARLRGFPVRADMLSRFRSPKQQQETLRRLRRGEVDIIVGTHRMVSKDVVFKDLGLVIVDEEQRFGVAAKEKLKQLASGVDTLTLTATPIPRTLNMAMSGIRDMSVLEEAPNDRVPVQTYVLEFDDVIIGEAIKKELRRGGQVFYLHNRVESMPEILAKVSQMAPEARIAVAHGKMDKEELSDIWRSMLTGEIDILISTTIIEAGVDVPNANTLIIEDSDRLGLSQLHQIRGRVGRSSRRAYAYFTYRKGAVLSDIASKRLGAIREYTEFGSGFKVALRDLEIRGAGNLLGSEQHGHMDTVGYDMYMRLLNEAILEEKGEAPVKKTECAVDMNISAYIPESYIKSPVQRIDVYKKISLVENVEDTVDIVDELLDRYGELPKPVAALLDVSLLRSLGSECSLTKIQKKGSSVIFWPEKIDIRIWTLLASERRGTLLMSLDLKPYVTLKLKTGQDPADAVTDVLNAYIRIKKNSAGEGTAEVKG